MKFTFTAALFAVASGAVAPDTASSFSQSFSPPGAHYVAEPPTGHLRGNFNHAAFARRLSIYPAPYQANSCLGDNFRDKCSNCMCLEGGEGNPVQTKRCDLDANPDGNDHCIDKGAPGSECHFGYDCQSNLCHRPDHSEVASLVCVDHV